MRFPKILATGLALTIAATSLVSTADARKRHRHHGGGEAFAAGILGFTAGALLGGAFAGPRYSNGYYYDDYPSGYYYDEPRYDYYAPAPRVYYRQAPVYYRHAPGNYYDPCNVPVGSSKPANAMC